MQTILTYSTLELSYRIWEPKHVNASHHHFFFHSSNVKYMSKAGRGPFSESIINHRARPLSRMRLKLRCLIWPFKLTTLDCTMKVQTYICKLIQKLIHVNFYDIFFFLVMMLLRKLQIRNIQSSVKLSKPLRLIEYVSSKKKETFNEKIYIEISNIQSLLTNYSVIDTIK